MMIIKNKRIRKKYLKLSVIGIIIATFFWFAIVSKGVSSKFVDLAKIETNNRIYGLINNIISNHVRKVDSEGFLILTQNKEKEIVLTEYNLKNVYSFLDSLSEDLSFKNDMIFFLPSGLLNKRFLTNYFGTKIPIRVKVSKSIYANIKTKITNYGLNNALAEIYLVIDVNYLIISPFDRAVQNSKYEILLSSYFINGKVPNIYSGAYVINSNIFDINQKI